MDYIAELQNAIRRLHGCESQHVETVPVTESFGGQTLWQSDVEVFDVHGHPTATTAYAWAQPAGQDDQSKRYIAVLNLPPVDSPQIAVRAALAALMKSEREETKGGAA